jgi:hypothetical protein
VSEPCKQHERTLTKTERIALCRKEIASIEGQLRAGHPDIEGLCLALSDWSWELRYLLGEPVESPVGQPKAKQGP